MALRSAAGNKALGRMDQISPLESNQLKRCDERKEQFILGALLGFSLE